ncbi:MAG: histidine kinase, partial [Vibrio sp.]
IQSEHQAQIQAQFPQARAHIVPNTGHWLHAEKPEAVLRVIDGFLNKLLD